MAASMPTAAAAAADAGAAAAVTSVAQHRAAFCRGLEGALAEPSACWYWQASYIFACQSLAHAVQARNYALHHSIAGHNAADDECVLAVCLLNASLGPLLLLSPLLL